MIFVEERLNLGIDYGTVGGPRFSTTVLTDGGGKDCCNANWSQPLGRWQLGNRTVNQEELEYLLVFHKLRSGAAQGFRFKDWGDFKGTNQLLDIGDGNKTQFQCVKTYSVGFSSVKRPITKIVAGTVKIYLNGVYTASGWTVDTTSGMVTFATPPANNTTIIADFEFDVPVRFEQDAIAFRFQAMRGNDVIFSLEALSILEIREEPTIALPIDPIPQFLSQTLDLGYDYDTVGGPRFNTTIIPVGAGFEKRDPNWTRSRGRWTIGDRTLKRSELEYFLAFFRVCRGAAVGFNFKDWQFPSEIKRVRFEQDNIDFRFDAYEKTSGESIFYLAGLNVIEMQALTHVFGTYYSKGGSFDGSNYYCAGGCNLYFYWRTIEPISNLKEDYSLVIKNDFWHLKNGGDFYQIDFIYPNNYLAKDTSSYRGYPQGPFSPHGVGIQYVAAGASCVQTGFSSPAYGDNAVITFTVDF